MGGRGRAMGEERVENGVLSCWLMRVRGSTSRRGKDESRVALHAGDFSEHLVERWYFMNWRGHMWKPNGSNN